jgi:hypothetical protein
VAPSVLSILLIMELWSGDGVLKYEGFEQTLGVRVVADEHFDAEIEVQHVLGFGVLLLGGREDITITLPNVEDPIAVYLRRASGSAHEEETIIFVPKRSPIWTHTTQPLVRGRASLANFNGFEVGAYSRARIQLSATGWDLTIIPVIEELLCHPEPENTTERMITHQLEFGKSDASPFTPDEMRRFLESLGQFFSFCHGGWIGMAFVEGMRADGSSELQAWGMSRIGQLSDPDSFVDRHHLECMVQLYPMFMTKMLDEDWAETISSVVYWLRRSELDGAGVDGGIILIQAALERFAWHVLVRDRGAISDEGFKALAAADQMRLMLNAMRIPRTVPEGLESLVRFAKAVGGIDAPEAFTRVRNRIVHPPKPKAKKVTFPYYDTYRLGRWYAELCVLSCCGYTGKYSNRVRKDQWVGQIEDVPWTSQL